MYGDRNLLYWELEERISAVNSGFLKVSRVNKEDGSGDVGEKERNVDFLIYSHLYCLDFS